MANKKLIGNLANILLIVGGLNWALFGIMDFNLVSTLAGTGLIAKIIYGLVGLSAVAKLFKKV